MKSRTDSPTDTATADRAIWLERLKRSEYVDQLLLARKVNLDRDTLRLLNAADGRYRLSDLAKDLLLSPVDAMRIAQQLIQIGYLQRPDAPPPSRDPLPADMRENVRRLRPILVRLAGPEAAFALELDAPHCRDLADLVVRMQRRFADPQEREQFTQAVLAEMSPPPATG